MSLPSTTDSAMNEAVDPSIQLRAMRRLAAYGDARRRMVTEWPDVIREAREARLSWTEISTFLGEPSETLRQRYRREVER